LRVFDAAEEEKRDEGWREGPSLNFGPLVPATEFGQRSAPPVDVVAADEDRQRDEAGGGRGEQPLDEGDGGDGEGDTPAGWPGMLGGQAGSALSFVRCCVFVLLRLLLACCCWLLLAVALFLHESCAEFSVQNFSAEICAEKSSAENCAEFFCRDLRRKIF